MKIVIDIPDEDYNVILANADFYKEQHWGVAEVWDAIVNGTSLPKGHGRLIDADTYRKDMINSREFNFFKILDMQPTVVAADKENDDETVN